MSNAARIFTDSRGFVLASSDDAARLLNLTIRGLDGRPLYLFITEGRGRVMNQIEIAARGHTVTIDTIVRPRDRRPRHVHIVIRRVADASGKLEWIIQPI